ncbi:hypothetical protein JST97_16195 [bacterium]|nr:hypothetical protein [bacterium]
MVSKKRGPLGFAVVALVLVIAFMFVLMTAGTTDSVNLGLRNTTRGTLERRTNYGAYGAMQLALDELNTSYVYSCDVHGASVPGDPELVYDLRICNNYNNDLAPNPPAGVTSAIPKGMVYIEAKCDLRDYIGQYTTKVYSKAALGSYTSNTTIIGTDQVTITNSTIDGYSVPVNAGAGSLKPYLSGAIVTNSVQAGGITLAGPNTVIKSGLFWGPKGPASVLSNPGPPGVTWTSTPPGWAAPQDPTPSRVPRFRPPRDPSDALSPAGVVKNITSPDSLTPANFKSISVTGTTLSLAKGEYFIAGNLTVTNAEVKCPDATGSQPCDIYVGGNVTITNSKVNWDNRLGSSDPAVYPTMMTGAPGDVPLVLDPTQLATQALLGPRTLRIFFVGSGAPRYKDCTFIAQNNSKISLVAAGKAMKVELLSGTEAWGGFKGSRFLATNAILHYHRTGKPAPPPP